MCGCDQLCIPDLGKVRQTLGKKRSGCRWVRVSSSLAGRTVPVERSMGFSSTHRCVVQIFFNLQMCAGVQIQVRHRCAQVCGAHPGKVQVCGIGIQVRYRVAQVCGNTIR